MDGIQVVLRVFREGVSLTHQAAQAGAQGAKPAFDVVGFSLRFATAAVSPLWERGGVSLPEVAAGGAAPVALGQGGTQIRRTLLAAVAEGLGDDLAGSSTQRHPEPKLASLAAHEAPKLVEFKHVAVFSGQERVHKRRETGRFFPPPNAGRSYNKRRRCG